MISAWDSFGLVTRLSLRLRDGWPILSSPWSHHELSAWDRHLSGETNQMVRRFLIMFYRGQKIKDLPSIINLHTETISWMRFSRSWFSWLNSQFGLNFAARLFYRSKRFIEDRDHCSRLDRTWLWILDWQNSTFFHLEKICIHAQYCNEYCLSWFAEINFRFRQINQIELRNNEKYSLQKM